MAPRGLSACPGAPLHFHPEPHACTLLPHLRQLRPPVAARRCRLLFHCAGACLVALGLMLSWFSGFAHTCGFVLLTVGLGLGINAPKLPPLPLRNNRRTRYASGAQPLTLGKKSIMPTPLQNAQYLPARARTALYRACRALLAPQMIQGPLFLSRFLINPRQTT